jgi:FdhD protein
MALTKVKIHRLHLERGISTIEDDIAVDVPVCILLNGEFYKTLITSPQDKEELAIGHLITEGVIREIDEIKEINIKGDRIYVELTRDIDLPTLSILRHDILTTACGYSTPINEQQLADIRITSELKIQAKNIIEMMMELNRKKSIFRKTGGTHIAILGSAKGEIKIFTEDVGRHNAIDKIVGTGILQNIDMDGSILLSSGRQSGEMVLKAVRSGIPIVASVSAPIQSGINVAEMGGVTLIGFVRGKRMNIYTHPDRITLE